ncbi:hypothetical protein AB0958_11475 [Streptomyces sp. NPDC006655]|uniref:hypothetical protein n=1 Tax=Streptomyces sp. NPDC006655 TaxID=3156898 RepID=UPI0034533BA0
MRAIRVASAALLGVGALALSAPAILANDGGGEEGRDGGRDSAPFGFRVTPSTVAAGGRVSFHLNRGDGCRGTATVASSLFDTIRIPAGQDSGTATVGRDVRSQGSYRVTFDCDGTSGSTELAVSEGGSEGGSDGHGDGRADDQSGGRSDGTTGGRSDGNTAGRTDGDTGGRTYGDSDVGGTGARDQELNPQPLPPSRGVRAGEGGSFDGFDLKEIGLGTALVLGSVGTAYRRARVRADEDGA